MTSTAIDLRPFYVDVPDEALRDLRRRIAATNWPDKETVADQSQGVPLAMLQKLARYWLTGYDWRLCEAELNALPQFITEIDGLDIQVLYSSPSRREMAQQIEHPSRPLFPGAPRWCDGDHIRAVGRCIKLLDDRARPSVIDDERQRVFML